MSTTGTTAGPSYSSVSDDEWKLKGPIGGGPKDPSILISFKGHVAYAIRNDPKEPCGPLHIQSTTNKLKRDLPKIEGNMGEASDWIETTRLRYLRDTYFHHHNAPLISAVIERWHLETNSFYLSFGEMKITLHDMYHIMGLRITGLSCTNPNYIDDDYVIPLLAQLLEYKDVNIVKGAYYRGSSVELNVLLYKLTEDRVASDHAYAILYMWYLLSCTFFVDKSGNRTLLATLRLVANLDRLGNMALVASVLAYLYKNLGILSRRDYRQLCGCITLLEITIIFIYQLQ